jgi:YebC/PmpR family DNA-binding regulatory protein
MSGHSKWATIKHKKGALDAKRGKTFTRLIKEITIAAKQGGGDPDGNTDNRNRTVSEIRHTFSKNGGNLGSTGSVMHMFSKKGLIAVEKSAASEEKLMDIVLEHGGEDLNDEGDVWEILTDPGAYEGVLNAVKGAGIAVASSEVTMIASTYTKLEGPTANQMMRLLEALEDFDDTQNVYSNFEMTAEQMEQVAG